MMILFIASITSCRSIDDIVYARSTKRPIETNGFMRIATNDKIPVTVDGDDKTYGEEDLGGMMVLRDDELALLIANTKKLQEILKNSSSSSAPAVQ